MTDKVKRKAKFRAGQVVAIWDEDGSVPMFYRIRGFFLDSSDEIRYTFEARKGDSLADSLQPVEKLLRPLTAREKGL